MMPTTDSQNRPKRASPVSRSSSRRFQLVLLVLVAVVAAMIPIVLRPRRQQAPKSDAPSLAEQVLAKARPLVDQGQFATAIDLMRAYVQARPDDVEVRPLLAEAELKAGRDRPAERTVDELLARAPMMARALWLKGVLADKRGGDGRPFYRKAAESPDATAEIWAGYGLVLLTAGRLDEAQKYLTRARSAGITDARTLGPLGQIALEQGRPEQAERLLGDALATERHNPRLWAMLAAAQVKAGRDDDALATLAEAADACGDAPQLLLRAGQIALAAGQTARAEQFLKKASDRLGANDKGVKTLDKAIRAANPNARTMPATATAPAR